MSRSRGLWSNRSVMGWRIPEEIFAVFFILVILSLAKDENVVNKVQNNVSVQIAIGILVLYCVYNKIPWSLAFVIGMISAVCFTGLLNDAKGTVGNIISKIKKDDATLKMGARVLGLMKKPKSILKVPEKKVSFEDDDICSKVSEAFGLDDPDTDAETTDNETEEDKENQRDDLLSFMDDVE